MQVLEAHQGVLDLEDTLLVPEDIPLVPEDIPLAGLDTEGCSDQWGRGQRAGLAGDHRSRGSHTQGVVGNSHPEVHTVAPGSHHTLEGSLTWTFHRVRNGNDTNKQLLMTPSGEIKKKLDGFPLQATPSVCPKNSKYLREAVDVILRSSSACSQVCSAVC